MNRDRATNCVSRRLELLRQVATRTRVQGNVGSRLDREERDARDLVRLLLLLETLRAQTAVP